MVTDYMVAQQYLTIMSDILAQNATSKVVLLPTKTLSSMQHIVESNW